MAQFKVFVLFLVLSFLGTSLRAAGPIGGIDWPRVIANHPDMAHLDPYSRRFLNDIHSRFLSNDEIDRAMQVIATKISEKEEMILGLNRELAQAIRGIPGGGSAFADEKSRIEKEFLEKKRKFSIEINDLKAKSIKIELRKGYNGKSSNDSIIAKLNAIVTETIAIVSSVARSRGIETILDVSLLREEGSPTHLPPLLSFGDNPYREFIIRGHRFEDGSAGWRQLKHRLFAGEEPPLFLFGGEDLTVEVISELNKIKRDP